MSKKTKQQHKQRRSEEKHRTERENEQFRWRREVLFIGNGGAYRRFQNAYMRSPIGVIQNAYMRSNAYRRFPETPICIILM